MTPSELTPGMLINYRGFPAKVVECWTRPQDARDGFDCEAAAVIEWEDTETRRCRLVWDYPTLEDGSRGAELVADGLNGPLQLWSE